MITRETDIEKELDRDAEQLTSFFAKLDEVEKKDSYQNVVKLSRKLFFP